MANKPKLSPEQWSGVRIRWESDKREGYAWLIEAMRLPVTLQAVSKRAKVEKWTKVDQVNRAQPSESKASTLPSMNDEVAPFKTRETAILDEIDVEEPRQGLFVREYLKDLNGTQAAIRSGYSIDSAGQTAYELLRKPEIQAAVRELREETLRKLEAKVEELVRYWLDILRADPNEITSYRRVCCYSCWGKDHQRQFTPLGYQDAKLRHGKERARILVKTNQAVDIGEFPSYEGDWYNKRLKPNPSCPECHGEGYGEHHFSDTRNLPPGVAALFNGVKKTKDGIEILLSSKEKAADQLGRFLGAFRDKEAGGGAEMPSAEALEEMFWARLNKARERQAAVNKERGLDGEDGA